MRGTISICTHLGNFSANSARKAAAVNRSAVSPISFRSQIIYIRIVAFDVTAVFFPKRQRPNIISRLFAHLIFTLLTSFSSCEKIAEALSPNATSAAPVRVAISKTILGSYLSAYEQSIRQYQSSFGVRIAYFDGFSGHGFQNVSWPETLARRHIFSYAGISPIIFFFMPSFAASTIEYATAAPPDISICISVINGKA